MCAQQLRRDYPSLYRLACVGNSPVRGFVTIITIIITERYAPKMRVNAIIHPRSTRSTTEKGCMSGRARHPIISFTFANCESWRRLAIRERGVATPVLCISSIHVAVSGTDPATVVRHYVRKRFGETLAQVCPAAQDKRQTSPEINCSQLRKLNFKSRFQKGLDAYANYRFNTGRYITFM